ncbi:uncharacterized protein FHR24_003126 [Wenyingzhuangia heitensis]|uniref:TPM domain-containing protein n=1 Tax=Wenyingzhuangia heitensis TaxID=1487859 RepID=A0ABX0UGX0_9FLAO|nr:TPM domain-containing protein [Wenyingzhuangia heitensis]NIJ46631.1 uncharacterized protein [Wenyingzhuangia heitensis]
MKTRKIKINLFLILLISITSLCNSQSIEKETRNLFFAPLKKEFPIPLGFINDFENILTKEERRELNNIISNFEKSSSNEIAIITINSIKPYTDIKQFTEDLSNEWGVGKKNKKNGLTILFSKNLRKIQISTGLNTEKIITNEICKNVIDYEIIPEFKKGKYYSGIRKGLMKLIEKWK